MTVTATRWAFGATCVDCASPLRLVNQTPIHQTIRGAHIAHQAQSSILACTRCGLEHEHRSALQRRNKRENR